MRTTRSLTVSLYLIVSHTRPPRSNHAHPPEQPRMPPPEQPRMPPLWTEWQTGVKILPCPKLRLRAVIMSVTVSLFFEKYWNLQLFQMEIKDITIC